MCIASKKKKKIRDYIETGENVRLIFLIYPICFKICIISNDTVDLFNCLSLLAIVIYNHLSCIMKPILMDCLF